MSNAYNAVRSGCAVVDISTISLAKVKKQSFPYGRVADLNKLFHAVATSWALRCIESAALLRDVLFPMAR